MRDITNEVLKHNAESLPFSDSDKSKLFDKNIRICAIEDKHYTFADLCGDTYNPAANPDIPKEQLLKEQKAFRSKVSKYKVWGCGIVENGNPDYDTFIWGFVGNDFIGSGYDSDLLRTLKERI